MKMRNWIPEYTTVTLTDKDVEAMELRVYTNDSHRYFKYDESEGLLLGLTEDEFLEYAEKECKRIRQKLKAQS